MSLKILKSEILRIEVAKGWTLDELNNFLTGLIFLYDLNLVVEVYSRHLEQEGKSITGSSEYPSQQALKIFDYFYKKNSEATTDFGSYKQNYSKRFYNIAWTIGTSTSPPDELEDSKKELRIASDFTPRVKRIEINSPGSFDFLGLGKVLEVIKDWYIGYKKQLRKDRKQRVDEIEKTREILKDLGIDDEKIEKILLQRMYKEKLISPVIKSGKINDMYILDDDEGGKKVGDLVE